MTRGKAKCIAFADFETTNPRDLENEGIVPRKVGNHIEDQYGEVIRVHIKGGCIIIHTREGERHAMAYRTMDEFLSILARYKVERVYFHNLKFDEAFVATYLQENDVTVLGRGYRSCSCKSLGRVMNDRGAMYSSRLEFTYMKPRGRKEQHHICEMWDSYKVWSSSLRDLGKSFGVEKLGEGSEEALRPGWDKQMEVYCMRDCEVVEAAMLYYFKKVSELTGGAKRYGYMTAASTAYNLCDLCLRKYRTSKNVDKLFPPCNTENGFPEWLREGYKGAVPLLDKEKVGKILRMILVFDVNSMYPDKLRNARMPVGKPLKVKQHTIEYLNELVECAGHYLWVAEVEMVIKVKKGHRPTYLLKRKGFHDDTLCPYLNDVADMTTQVITNVDWELIERDYDIIHVNVVDARAFKSEEGVLMPFIDEWYRTKSEASKSGDKALKSFSKLVLNSTYGKFGANPEHINAEYDFFDDIARKVETTVETDAKPKYLPLAMFTTAYARNEISILCNAIGWDHVVYTDTDSLHVVGLAPSEAIRRIETSGYKVHPDELGALKFETMWARGMYIRNKGYAHETRLNPEDGGVMYDKEGQTINETKLAGATGLKWTVLESLVDTVKMAVRKTRYSVKGGAFIWEDECAVDTRLGHDLDVNMKHKNKFKGMTQKESDMHKKKIEDEIFMRYGWCHGTG